MLDIQKGQSTQLKSVYNYLQVHKPVLFPLAKVLQLEPLKLWHPSLSKKEKWDTSGGGFDFVSKGQFLLVAKAM